MKADNEDPEQDDSLIVPIYAKGKGNWTIVTNNSFFF